MYKFKLLGKYRVLIVTICINLTSFSTGTFLGWTSPVMPKLRQHTPDSPLTAGVTASQEGWISSLSAIGALAVPFFIGPLTSIIGRKKSLLIFSLIQTVSYVFLILAKNLWLIYVARFFQGFAGGGAAGVIPMYTGEIAPDNSRGALCSLMTVFIMSGTLYSFIIGPYVNYITLQYCCLVVPVLFFVAFIFLPESPYYFAIKGKKSELVDSLRVLRGKQNVEVERAKIQKEVDDSMENKSEIADIFRNGLYRKSIFITCGVMLFHETSGTTAITFNSQSIFISAGSKLDPAAATIILGLVQLLSNILTPFVIESFGRKKILYISSIGMAVPLTALGIFFYKKTKESTNISWVPVPALIMFKAFYGFGFGPVPWTIMGEIFPSNIKSAAMSIACSFTWFLAFIITRWFPELNALGEYYAFWLFGGFCAVGLFFVKFFVVETKGLSLQMIQEKLKSST